MVSFNYYKGSGSLFTYIGELAFLCGETKIFDYVYEMPFDCNEWFLKLLIPLIDGNVEKYCNLVYKNA
jgi:hypothetical protein